MTAPEDPEPGARMAAEIASQPETLARLLDHGLDGIRAVAERLRSAGVHTVVLAARGSSDHAALYAKYLIEISLGLPAALASPSALTVYGAHPTLSGVAWLAVSQSGGSPDLVESTATARECGALTVAVTNAPGSPLTKAAELHVDILAGAEQAVAATKTYTSQLLALWLLVDAWRGGDASPARSLPDTAGNILDTVDVSAVADHYRFVDRLVTTARGYSYATAREAALKLMETSYLSAHAFSAADLLHGPFAMIDVDRPVLVIASGGRSGEAVGPVLERLADRSADVCLVGDPALARPGARVIPLPTDVPEDLTPILEVIPLQRLAHAMAVARHHDPDAPRGLHKVTETW